VGHRAVTQEASAHGVLFKPQLLLPPHWSQGFNRNSGNTCWSPSTLMLAVLERLLLLATALLLSLVPCTSSTTQLAGHHRLSTQTSSSGNHGTCPTPGSTAMPHTHKQTLGHTGETTNRDCRRGCFRSSAVAATGQAHTGALWTVLGCGNQFLA
jgi:hypothetical protein